MYVLGHSTNLTVITSWNRTNDVCQTLIALLNLSVPENRTDMDRWVNEGLRPGKINTPLSAFASECVIYDDGIGAQITFNLPTRGEWNGKKVEYTTFRIFVAKGEKILLLSDLPGKYTDNGSYFSGKIIIPSEFIDSAEILLLGGPPNSSLGVENKLKVREFKRISRKKSWAEQE